MEQIIRPTGLLDPRDHRAQQCLARSTTSSTSAQGSRRPRRAGAHHHAHEEDGRGSDRPPAGPGREGALHALGHRTRSSAWRYCASCARASSTCWWASTCCARAWTCRRCRSWPSWTPTRKASCAADRSLIQTIGRAARNVSGQVIMYADTHDRLHGACHRRDEAPPLHTDAVQRGPRHRAADHPQGHQRHHGLRDRRGGQHHGRAGECRAGRALARGGAAHHSLHGGRDGHQRPRAWTTRRRPACATRW